MLLRVLVVTESGGALRQRLTKLLQGPDTLVDVALAKRALRQPLSREVCDLAVLQRSCIPGDAAAFTAELLAAPDAPGAVVVADREDAAERAALLAAGCDAVLYGGLSDQLLQSAIETILNRRRTIARQDFPGSIRSEPALLQNIPARSASMAALLDFCRRLVQADSTLLILGETGVGKEHLARAIHADSPRAAGPFLAVNCGGLPENLLESELFGHEAGAFTGATHAHCGAFELAHRGTLFLDEIGDMPFHLQVKLLRVLQDHVIKRLGSERTIPLDVRIMAASNREMEPMLRGGAFRPDLYYRLSVVSVTVPPLRERRDDIPQLVTEQLARLRQRLKPHVEIVAPEAMDCLCAYDWPGNIRELLNVVERAMLLCDQNTIRPEHLPETIARGKRQSAAPSAVGAAPAPTPGGLPQTPPSPGLALPPEWEELSWPEIRRQALAVLERAYLDRLLQGSRGRIGECARRAGMHPRSLYAKMRVHGLDKADYKPYTWAKPMALKTWPQR